MSLNKTDNNKNLDQTKNITKFADSKSEQLSLHSNPAMPLKQPADEWNKCQSSWKC